MNIIACGPTGALWDGSGPSIGVNDCEKFGKPVDSIVVVNSLFHPDRMRVIQQHKGKLYSSLPFWAKHPVFSPIETTKFKGRIETSRIYHSISSPIIAISLSHVLGYRDIVLFGVDFDNHAIIKDDVLNREVGVYLDFIRELELIGTKVYLGAGCTGAFKNLIPCIQK